MADDVVGEQTDAPEGAPEAADATTPLEASVQHDILQAMDFAQGGAAPDGADVGQTPDEGEVDPAPTGSEGA